MTYEIPYTMGLQPRVILGGFCSGFVRTFIECPFEYIKVKRQTLQEWKMIDIYKGAIPLLLRTTGVMSIYLICVDSFRRNTNMMNHFSG
jgi:hypothetical protein